MASSAREVTPGVRGDGVRQGSETVDLDADHIPGSQEAADGPSGAAEGATGDDVPGLQNAERAERADDFGGKQQPECHR